MYLKSLVIAALTTLLFACVIHPQAGQPNNALLKAGLHKHDGLQRQILSFESDGLVQFALVLSPEKKTDLANKLVVFAHGYHPEPPKYGKNQAGENDRPGDYYRNFAEQYSHAGYTVLVPDFRGHNQSEGLKYTYFGGGTCPVKYYARDLIAAYEALLSVKPQIDKQFIIVSHSMGTAVAVLAADISPDRVLGASLWAGGQLEEFPVHDTHQFILHHADRETVVPVYGSESFAGMLNPDQFTFFRYDSDKHLLEENDFSLAIQRDLEFITLLYAPNEPPH